MPSLRKKVSTYLRQLSFHGETRRNRGTDNVNDNCFITKYLSGENIRCSAKEAPIILFGKELKDLPCYELGHYSVGPETVLNAHTGPDGGLTAVNRSQKHLSIADPEIDFIDIHDEQQNEDAMAKSIERGKDVIAGINNWQNPSEHAFGVSNTLYEKNPITNKNNGDPIADCFGIIARKDSAILALADGVNWGQKASIAAKSAVHGCMHYLNNTIFSGTRDFSTLPDNSFPSSSINSCSSKIAQRMCTNVVGSRTATSQSSTSSRKGRTVESLLVDSTSSTIPRHNTEKIYRQPAHIQKPPRGHKNKRLSNTVPTLKLPQHQGKSASLSSSSNYSTAKSTLSSDEVDLKNAIRQDDRDANALSSLESQKSDDQSRHNLIVNTEEVFISLLRSFYEAHTLILENDGMLTTLTVAIVLPLKPKSQKNENDSQEVAKTYLGEDISPSRSFDSHTKRDSLNIPNTTMQKYICCVCNLGDSLAYVYSKKHGIRELTQGSHDVHSMRDMRDALGALGPVDGKNPELNNLTLSMSILEPGDIVFITSDGVSDNYDPVVGKFAVLPPSPKEVRSNASIRQNQQRATSATSSKPTDKNQRPKFLRSNTSLMPNNPSPSHRKSEIVRSKDGLPIVKAFQRHELTLLRMEDLLNKGISGHEKQCATAKQLAQMLVDFSLKITAAKRHFLEDIDLYYEESNKILVELSSREQKLRRKKCLEKISTMPGKLDHASVVAYSVGCCDLLDDDNNSLLDPAGTDACLETNF